MRVGWVPGRRIVPGAAPSLVVSILDHGRAPGQSPESASDVSQRATSMTSPVLFILLQTSSGIGETNLPVP